MIPVQEMRLKFIEDIRKMRDTLINTITEIDNMRNEANTAEMQSLARLRVEVTSLEEGIRSQQTKILATNINALRLVN
jgi:hypothetical protein